MTETKDIYYIVFIPVHDHETNPQYRIGNYIEIKKSTIEEAMIVFEDANNAYNYYLNHSYTKGREKAIVQCYKIAEKYSGISGFINGKPSIYECKMLK